MNFNSERINHWNYSQTAMENSLSKANLKAGFLLFAKSHVLLLVDSWVSQLYRLASTSGQS